MMVNSLDDNIIVRKNLMLLDNVTNLERPAVDYFHYDFASTDNLAMPQTWNLLCKVGKYKVLRLPSCSLEDDMDYNMYLKRLHHCLWRRWSMNQFHLTKKKIDPLRINWNKELDMTVLYGPEVANTNSVSRITKDTAFLDKPAMVDDSLEEKLSDEKLCYSSSLESRDSSIFDQIPHGSCLKRTPSGSGPRKSLHFNNHVLRRDIDSHGSFHEREVFINDAFPIRAYRRPQKNLTVRSDCFIIGSPDDEFDSDIDMLYDDDDDFYDDDDDDDDNRIRSYF